MGTKPVLLHLDEEVHAALKKAAAELGTSVAGLLREGAAMVLAQRYGGHRARSMAVNSALETIADVSGKLAAGYVLVPVEHVNGTSWGGILDERSS